MAKNKIPLPAVIAKEIICDPDKLFATAEEWATNDWDASSPILMRVAGYIILQLLFDEDNGR